MSLPNLPRLQRYSLGMKIEQQFLDLLENLLLAGYAVREQKPTIMAKASVKLDLLKFFLQVAWELKSLDNKQYAQIIGPIHEIGKMLGGWIKQTQTK